MIRGEAAVQRTPARDIATGVLAHAALIALPSILRGQGVEMLRDAACVGVLALSSTLCALEAAATRSGGDGPSERGARRDACRRVSLITGVSLLATFWLCISERLDDVEHAGGGRVGWELLGACVVLAGIAIRWAAIRELGRDFVSAPRVRSTQALVTRGVFAVVRHPSETGLLAVALGTVLLCGSAWGAAVTVVCTLPSCVVRILREERCLAAAFRDEHSAYRRSVPALIPCVW